MYMNQVFCTNKTLLNFNNIGTNIQQIILLLRKVLNQNYFQFSNNFTSKSFSAFRWTYIKLCNARTMENIKWQLYFQIGHDYPLPSSCTFVICNLHYLVCVPY
jgi:hypothetical protein